MARLKTKKVEVSREERIRISLLRKRTEVMEKSRANFRAAVNGEGVLDYVGDEMDIAAAIRGNDLSANLSSLHNSTVKKIDEALRRMGEGGYGICEDCGEEIPEQRLIAVPDAIRCIDCQEEFESRRENLSIDGISGN